MCDLYYAGVYSDTIWKFVCAPIGEGGDGVGAWPPIVTGRETVCVSTHTRTLQRPPSRVYHERRKVTPEREKFIII